MLSITMQNVYAGFRYAECHYTEWRYTHCRFNEFSYAGVLTLNVIIVSAIMLTA